MLKIYLSLIIFASFCCSFAQKPVESKANSDTLEQGLYFVSHTVSQEKRTGLNLTPEEPMNLGDGFELEFDIKLRKEQHNYGYIFRMILDDTLNIDLISNIWVEKDHFILVKKNEKLLETELSEISNYLDNWINVKLKIDAKNQEVIYCINNKSQNIKTQLPKTKNIRIYFGKNNDLRFYCNDVPPVIVKNVRIVDLKGNEIRNWPLLQHSGSNTFDLTDGNRATVVNPVWEIDKHIHWKKLIDIQVEGINPQIAFDEASGRIFIAKKQELRIYKVGDEKCQIIHIKEGKPYESEANDLIYDGKSDRLISYHISQPNFILYNPTLEKWEPEIEGSFNTMIQHNQMIARDRNELITFGGYGQYNYNAILAKKNLDGGDWLSKDISQTVAPRYLSSAGYLGNGQFLLLGGYGSISGKQEESPQNFNDLYKINVDDYSCTKLWQIADQSLHQAFSNSMVVEQEKQLIYVLAYENDRRNTFIQLNSFGINNSEKTILGDSIPYLFHDISSYCNLFLNQSTNQLISIVSYATDDNNTTVSIYALAYPPLPAFAVNTPQGLQKEFKMIFLLVIILLLAFLVAGYIFYRSRRKKDTEESRVLEMGDQQIYKIKEKASCIILLGGLQFIDSKGEDVTGHFSAVARSLFLFILLNTLKNGKGVASNQIDEAIWPDMDKNKAKNNRNVNMSKLRTLLKDFLGINILSNNNYWTLDIDKKVFCDYAEAMLLISMFEDDKNLTEVTINKIIELASYGNLLPANSDEWLDEFKATYSNRMSNLLSEIVKNLGSKKDFKLLLRISNAMLMLDNIDEDAIEIKCNALYHLGKKGLAKKEYETFCEEYRKILNTSPKMQFSNIVKGG